MIILLAIDCGKLLDVKYQEKKKNKEIVGINENHKTGLFGICNPEFRGVDLKSTIHTFGIANPKEQKIYGRFRF